MMTIDTRHALLTERMEHGATEALDRRLMVLIRERERLARAGWFS